ncbi:MULTISPECIES: YuiA family protein [Alkalihalophilus]|uniref:YuiA family protein n=3 Tax=Alkalihalophilus TaxID=2893060 RepID=D3FYZ2_ALKPO|nr:MULTISPECIES: YuiA family protein [Alkalihalophilus]ADC49025.1 hypothetical protein BpOF4_04805 [Alkalihalophilus pseudofirmus OF4]ERN52212.1 hypothetical protein A33I_17035 [Alkalihalophilus marmarensis DSM 21297]MCM3491572.1 YuiA family protein [Alkalihalophilus marmarensis]MDV2886127.1 YuiA family protein [Alkalihalophilus pseudofirmus]MEC2071111.1 YuiA family protein [Alkalihalophilus marmarensis]
MKRSLKYTENGTCPYCNGVGYFQLLLGGSETCEHCGGHGKSHKKQ